MKLKSLFLALLVMAAGVVTAQVESGKVYRIVSSKYETVITASPITNKLSCVTPGSAEDYQQMWEFEYSETSGKYTIRNVFSRRYIQNESGTNVAFKTGTNKVYFAIRENAEFPGNYDIDASNRVGGWGLHCASNAEVVPWSDGTGEVSGTEWKFEEVSISELEKEQAYADYVAYNTVLENKETIIEKVNALFADNAGTELKAEYAAMTDADLLALMDGVPADLQQAVLKVKNNTWATEARANLSEKNFRIYDYKPYSSPEKWKEVLYTRYFNRINNPTGICSESDKGYIYVWVDEIPEGTFIDLAEMKGTAYFGPNTHDEWIDGVYTNKRDVPLTTGLNIVPSALKDGVLYIRYVCDTDTAPTGKKLADYPRVKVHIEGGYVNGFWSKERGHTNEDWVYMRDNMFRNEEAVQAVGDHSVLNFRKYEFLMPYQYTDNWGFRVEGCPENIETVMKFWDFWNERQRWYMGLDKFYDWFNNKQLAMSDDGGFMDAGNYRTHYNNNTLTTIVNLDRISRDGGSAWGPNHEIGHTNQYAFEIVGTSEVSNNALTNFAIFDTGTHTSRGWNMDAQIKDYENRIPYVVRGEKEYGSELFSMTRMYFQLFLYFHAAEKKPDFYPILFEELRKDKLVGWSVTSKDQVDANGFNINSVNAVNDQLKFVEKCCSIAQMDLTEFFEAWGFFVPMKNAYVGDYGHHYVYLLQEDIKACKARIKAANYPKKGGHLMFLEDRIRHSKQKKSILNENPSGYRYDYSDEAPVANNFCGLFGQWEDYIDETVKAQGYYYVISNGVVTIVEGDDAKGALGFKLYDADSNELITYTNRLSMKIPANFSGRNYKVTAAQADGEDYVVPHASQGPESMQRDALEKSLSSAKKYTLRKVIKGTEIGFFFEDSLAYLTQIYNEANKAYKNYDTSTHSYAEWSIMLDNECRRLINTEGTRLMFEEGMEVKIYSNVNDGILTNTSLGVIANTIYNVNSIPEQSRWIIEYAGEKDVYYLKCADGYYLKNLDYNSIVYAENTKPVADVRIKINYTDNGYIYFEKYGSDTPVGLGASDKYVDIDGKSQRRVLGMTPTDDASQWYAYAHSDNSAAAYKEMLDDALFEARMVIAEVLNLDSLNTMNIFNNTIIVKDRNLESYAVDLYNLYLNVVTDVDNAAKHKSYLNAFRELFRKINGTYVVTGPLSTKGDKIYWYRLMEKDGGDYLSISTSTTATNKDRLALADEKKLDDNALWAFAPTGRQNEYKVFNCELEGFVSLKEGKNANYMYVTENAMPVKLLFDAEKNALTITDGSKFFRKQSTFVNLADKKYAANWVFELVAIEDNSDLADIITIVEGVLEEGDYNQECYDLSGRKVLNPGKGIYIQNGKKVLFK